MEDAWGEQLWLDCVKHKPPWDPATVCQSHAPFLFFLWSCGLVRILLWLVSFAICMVARKAPDGGRDKVRLPCLIGPYLKLSIVRVHL